MDSMIWHYSPAATEALEAAGVITRNSRQNFVWSILSLVDLQEGETEVNFMGLGLRIYRRGQGYLVQTLRE